MNALRVSISSLLLSSVVQAAEPTTLVFREYDPGFLPNPRWGRITYTLKLDADEKASLQIVLERNVDKRKQMSPATWETNVLDDKTIEGTWSKKSAKTTVKLSDDVTLECAPKTMTIHAPNASVAYVNDCTPCYDSKCAKPPKWTPAKTRSLEVTACKVTNLGRRSLPEILYFSPAPGVEWLFGDTDCPPTGLRDVIVSGSPQR